MQLSAVEGVPSDATVAVHVPAPAFTLMLEGHVIVGTVTSTGVIVKAQSEELPWLSHTCINTTVGVLITVPATGDCVVIGDGSQLSVTVMPSVVLKFGNTYPHVAL